MNTVQFSNHTQYREGWQGMVMPGGHIRQLVNGLAEIGVLAECDALLSGYLGSAEQGRDHGGGGPAQGAQSGRPLLL